MQYSSGDNLKLMNYSPTIDGVELRPPVFPNGFPIEKNVAAKVSTVCACLISFRIILFGGVL